MKKQLMSFLQKSAEFENCVANLYLFYSRIFKEDQSFWLSLYIEERAHAAVFDIFLNDQIPLEQFPIGLIDADPGSLDQNLAQLKADLLMFQESAPVRNDAFNYALRVEDFATEKKFQETITQDTNEGVLLLLQRINGDSYDHYRRIKNYMEQHEIYFS
jgi:hypothetical protein